MELSLVIISLGPLTRPGQAVRGALDWLPGTTCLGWLPLPVLEWGVTGKYLPSTHDQLFSGGVEGQYL